MKRALAERAKQTLGAVTKAKEQQHHHHRNSINSEPSIPRRVIQEPSSSPSLLRTVNRTNSGNYSENSNSIRNSTTTSSSRDPKLEERSSRPSDPIINNNDDERPAKIQRIEDSRTSTTSNAQTTTTTIPSPRSLKKKIVDKIESANNSNNNNNNNSNNFLNQPLKRRFSLELSSSPSVSPHEKPTLHKRTSSISNSNHNDNNNNNTDEISVTDVAPTSKSNAPTSTTTTTNKKSKKQQRTEENKKNCNTRQNDSSDEEPTDDSAFYLKHQNRALATELKSLQFAVSQLEEERTSRRKHCHEATKSIQSLQQIWKALEDHIITVRATTTTAASTTTTADNNDDHNTGTHDTSSSSQTTTPPSTGTGESVEWTRAFHNELVALGHGPLLSNKDSTAGSSSMSILEQATANIAARANLLQEYWTKHILLQQLHSPESPHNNSNNEAVEKLHNLQREMAVLTARCTELEAQVIELSQSRSDLVARERRIRRNLYPMDAGILTPNQVVQALSSSDDDIEATVQLEKQQLKEKEQPNNDDTNNSTTANSSSAEQPKHSIVSTAIMDELKAKISTLEEAAVNAEKTIQELNNELTEKERRITELSKRQLSDDDALKLESLESTLQKLKTAEENIANLESKFNKREERWALALGNEKAALNSVDELISKFNKRWAEITNQSVLPMETTTSADETIKSESLNDTAEGESPEVQQSKTIALLQHKLDQALENVRQSETTRENLKIALSMNGSLQTKLDELKAKYNALQSGSRSGGTTSSSRSGQSSSHSSSHQNASHDRESSRESSSKDGPSDNAEESSKYSDLQSKYKKLKVELGRLTNSRESAKAKCERAEKERDSLMESNVRLMNQIGEKDDMNAKSLSTILHLKSLTEKLTAERDNLEQQAKSASQLALAARLATNAKERVSDEILKEKKALEDRVEELENLHKSTQAELDRVSSEWSDASGKMAVKDAELSNALKRSDELATENEHKREEIRKLVDVVNKAEREAKDANKKLAEAMKSGIVPTGDDDDISGGTNSISVEHLKTQISVLKNRLACPVCHYRDKECIILRCRHMHCKQCVDERISNRSRKCPTCNVKFSENDVGDVWLN